MNRGHGTQEIQTLIEKCKKLRPETTVTGDIIAGFPGETEKEHNESKEFLVSAGFHKLHVFPFSLRNDTPAEHIPHHIPLQEKQRRAKEIRDLSDTLFQKWKQENFGKIFEVLVEKNGTGLTPNYFRVNTGDFLANTIQKMVIENDEL
jgi:threonylcarbamoyladenosine tRNA methylthiotransferase MtaB